LKFERDSASERCGSFSTRRSAMLDAERQSMKDWRRGRQEWARREGRA